MYRNELFDRIIRETTPEKDYLFQPLELINYAGEPFHAFESILFRSVLREADNKCNEITETDEEQLMDDSQLKRHCVEFAQNNFQEMNNGKIEGKLFLNKSMNAYIRFSNVGFSEWRGKARKRDHILAIKLIDVFLENANFSHVEQNNHDKYNKQNPKKVQKKINPNIKEFAILSYECKINGNPYPVTIKVSIDKRPNIHNKFYYLSLQDLDVGQ